MPRIVLPLSLVESEDKLAIKYIITHELVHIRRFDNIIKILAVFALCMHWFNPLMWISFILCQKDMEMSCDEKVMEIFDEDIRRDYATLLINLSVKQNMLINSGILAFGESNIKSRVKSIMKYKKSTKRVIVIAGIVILALVGSLMSNAEIKMSENKRVVKKTTISKNNIEKKIDKEIRSEEHTSELQSRQYLVCRLLLEKKKNPHPLSFIIFPPLSSQLPHFLPPARCLLSHPRPHPSLSPLLPTPLLSYYPPCPLPSPRP